MKRKRKIKWKNVSLFIIIIILSISLIISLIDIIKWMINNSKTSKQIDNIKEIVDKEEIIIDNIIKNENVIYDPLSLINVNLDRLKEINIETSGWIVVNGTNIDYPYVKTENNNYYLNHSFDRSYNDAGWVFLDYRNKTDLSHKNNIIYAHSRLDKTMFGSLSKVFNKEWINNKDNHYIKISNDFDNSLWQIFSTYIIETTNDYLQIDFNNDEEFIKFSNMLMKRSSYNYNIKLNNNDKILTLSTCYNDEKKIVVHAKRIK